MNLSVKQLISEEQCYATIRDMRWSGKVRCPHCTSEQIIKRGKHSHQTARCRYECKRCGKRFDDLTGIGIGRASPAVIDVDFMLVLYGIKPIKRPNSARIGLKQRRLTV